MRIPPLGWVAIAVWIACWFLAPEIPYVPEEPSDWVRSIRTDFANRAGRFGGDGADLLPGLVLGDTSRVSDSLDVAMRTASLSHLTAVSGANCAVIVSIVFGLCALLQLDIWWRIGASGAALTAFVVIVGAQPSVVRAAIMAVIALVALGLGRPTSGLTILSAAIVVALAIAPPLSHSIGFALSVAATAGLLVLVHPLREWFGRRLPDRLALVLAVPVAAQIAVQPLLLVFAPVVPTYGVPANALADPLAPVATVLGLFALLLGGLPWLATPILWGAWMCSAAIAWLARTFSEFPGALIPWPPGGWGIGISAALTGLGAWALVQRKPAPGVVAAIGVIAALSTTIGGGVVSWLSAPSNWTVAQCDVGQGDAVLVRDSGYIALIDTGREERPIRECLSRLGVDRIDLLVLTHFDIDHAGGYGAVVGRVGTVIHGPPDGLSDDITLQTLQGGGARVIPAQRGLTGTLGRLDWRVLWPAPTYPTEPGNPSSVILQFAPGSRCDSTCLSTVDLGDLPAREQSAMLGLGGLHRVDVVKMSHHGSKDQSPELYARLRASIGLIGVGADNDYGHPTDFAMQLLASSGTTTIRSDRRGIALVAKDADGTIRVWTERSG